MNFNAAIGFYRCPVCNRAHGEHITVHTSGLVFADTSRFMGWALCPRDEQLHAVGFVALVEVADLPEGETAYEQFAAADRTGNVFHILRERFEQVFNTSCPPWPLQFIDPGATEIARERDRLSLH